MVEHELKVPQEAPILDAARMTEQALMAIAEQIHQAQLSVIGDSDQARQYLRLASVADWAEKIKRGEVYYTGNEQGLEFCSFREYRGSVTAEQILQAGSIPQALSDSLPKDKTPIRVYKVGGLTVRQPNAIHTYAETFKGKDIPGALIIARTHGGIGRLLQRTGYFKIAEANLHDQLPSLEELYYLNDQRQERPGADFFIRPPLITE